MEVGVPGSDSHDASSTSWSLGYGDGFADVFDMEEDATDQALRREEYLREHTLGELKPLSVPISVVDYDPQWPVIFRKKAEKIRTALGERVLRVEHVGSTSVPDLPAKPIIELVLVVADTSDEGQYIAALENAGDQLCIREPGWYEHRMLRDVECRVNPHVFSAGCPEVDRMLTFRDWLRANDADRELYAHSKRTLPQKEWKYTQNYADAMRMCLMNSMKRPSLHHSMSRLRASSQ